MAIVIFFGIFALIGMGSLISYYNKKKKCVAVTTAQVVDVIRKVSYDNNRSEPQNSNSGISINFGGAGNYHDNFRSESVSFYPIYEYTVNDIVYQKQARIGSANPKVHKGQSIQLFYNPENPEQFYTSEENSSIIVGAIFLLVGICGGLYFFINS